jgi:hypothetical protein
MERSLDDAGDIAERRRPVRANDGGRERVRMRSLVDDDGA